MSKWTGNTQADIGWLQIDAHPHMVCDLPTFVIIQYLDNVQTWAVYKFSHVSEKGERTIKG